MKDTAQAWIAYHRPNPQARLRMFCFPYAGGGASIFRMWSDNLPPGVDLCPIQLPGRENRLLEPTVSGFPFLLPALTQALGRYMDMPFVFFGHSVGALIGFELARHLRSERGLGPVHLFVSGRRPPQVPDDSPALHRLPDPAFVDALRRLRGTPEEVLQDVELMRLLLPALRADFAISETYRYAPAEPLECSISAFAGTDDPVACKEDLLGWREQTRRHFRHRVLPGNHFFLKSARALLLRRIVEDLGIWLEPRISRVRRP